MTAVCRNINQCKELMGEIQSKVRVQENDDNNLFSNVTIWEYSIMHERNLPEELIFSVYENTETVPGMSEITYFDQGPEKQLLCVTRARRLDMPARIFEIH